MKGCFLKRMNHHNWLELDCHAQGYQALNNILQPIREKMLPLTQYADSLAEWEPVFFQPEQCDWWLERWDREDDVELLKISCSRTFKNT